MVGRAIGGGDGKGFGDGGGKDGQGRGGAVGGGETETAEEVTAGLGLPERERDAVGGLEGDRVCEDEDAGVGFTDFGVDGP